MAVEHNKTTSEEDKKMTSEEKYKLLINARNFHYENFNKWMTYYYVAIGALFVAYYTLITKSLNLQLQELLLLALGFIVSLFWYWCCKGYYYWMINFILLIHHYEKNILKFKEKEGIYSVFANKESHNSDFCPTKGTNISTSKVTMLFAFIVSIAWGFLFVLRFLELQCPNYFDICFASCPLFFSFIAIFLVGCIVFFSSGIAKKYLNSNLEGLHDLKLPNR